MALSSLFVGNKNDRKILEFIPSLKQILRFNVEKIYILIKKNVRLHRRSHRRVQAVFFTRHSFLVCQRLKTAGVASGNRRGKSATYLDS